MTEDTFHLVHVNIATGRAAMDDPIMKGFVDQVDDIDALAQSWPGFIAQAALPDEGLIYSGNTLVNISIWESVDDLREFTYQSRHAEALKMRSEWFFQSEQPNYVLYWSFAGEMPTEVEILKRFEHLNQNGPTPYAFNFNNPFTVEEMLNYQVDEQEQPHD